MPSFSSTPTASTRMPADAVLEAPSRWVDDDGDLMLGCECANPALQIERWGQDEAGMQALAS